jgi:hypothetical protein
MYIPYFTQVCAALFGLIFLYLGYRVSQLLRA